MIIVTVYLASAVDDSRSKELARMVIANDGTGDPSGKRHNYSIATLFGRSREQLNKNRVHKSTTVEKWPRDAFHIWNLVATALTGMGYGDKR